MSKSLRRLFVTLILGLECSVRGQKVWLMKVCLLIKHLYTAFVTKVFYSIFKLFPLQPWDFDISLICYDNANFTGEWKRFTEYTPDLGPLEFDNRIEACILTGL